MKIIYVLAFLFVLQQMPYAQDEKDKTTYQYLFVDEVPKFGEKGGDFSDYLYENIKLPKNFSDKDKILVSFVIDEKGKVCDVEIIKSYSAIFNDAVIEVLSSMPKWKPGKLKGEFVKVQLYLELVFKLD